MMTWTKFKDMHSGGSLKQSPYRCIYIEAPQAEAELIFFNRFGHNPNRVSCTCCGEDYSMTESPSLRQASGFERGCAPLETPRKADGTFDNTPGDPWFRENYYLEPDQHDEAAQRGYRVGRAWHCGEHQTVEDYVQRKDVLVIHAGDIKLEERTGTLPQQGFIWHD
jgi:hypothetical protein